MEQLLQTKELTPLEALKLIRCDIDADIISSNEIECCKIIEKALKEADFLAEHYKELLTHSKKQDKVLKIIKEKDFVDINLLKKSSNMYEYNRNLAYRYGDTQRKNDICLIQNEEEFNLLKEVLL